MTQRQVEETRQEINCQKTNNIIRVVLKFRSTFSNNIIGTETLLGNNSNYESAF